MHQRVVIGMSGGVDSSVAAALLLRAGYDVIGVTIRIWPQNCLKPASDECCGPSAMVDAWTVAKQLGFPHYVVDEQIQFQKFVIDYFVAEYRAGRTPNPCVLCNEQVKFGALLNKARSLGAEFIATGHYARVQRSAPLSRAAGEGQGEGRTLLLRSRDPQKDQSYFLFSLKQEQLQHVLFPLGEMNKTQTRALAAELNLKVAAKKESQEICFVPGHDYHRFLREEAGLTPRDGEIVDRDGRVLGRHAGIEYFTIGQRKGLGIAGTQPYYVVALDASTNQVIVGAPEELMTTEFYVERPNWIVWRTDDKNFILPPSALRPPPFPLRCTVQIRSQHKGAHCTITPTADGRVRVILDRSERAVTPGQAAVFYDGDIVLGGGWIGAEKMG